MPITPDEIRHVATLARLELNNDELNHLSHDLDRIVAYVEQLAEIDTTGIEPVANIAGLENITRVDEIGPMLDRSDVLRCAPQSNDCAFLVPKAVER